ncbi:MAG TPA: hypothetical protein VG672_20245, partial [Bryobacteraceae bacterium]|nr:hypothetical protein [Bryobacteraceae bacterium]
MNAESPAGGVSETEAPIFRTVITRGPLKLWVWSSRICSIQARFRIDRRRPQDQKYSVQADGCREVLIGNVTPTRPLRQNGASVTFVSSTRVKTSEIEGYQVRSKIRA